MPSSNLGRHTHTHHAAEKSRCTSWDDDGGDRGDDGGDHVGDGGDRGDHGDDGGDRGDDEDHLLDNDGDYDREDNNQYQHVNISNSAVVYLKRQTQQATSTP